jgi:vacuolar-type H+-ATPase subunit I/STV1
MGAQANITFAPEGTYLPDIIMAGTAAGGFAAGNNITTQLIPIRGIWVVKWNVSTNASDGIVPGYTDYRMILTRSAGAASVDLGYQITCAQNSWQGQILFECFDSTDLFRLVAGPLGIAVGTEHRWMYYFTFLGSK